MSLGCDVDSVEGDCDDRKYELQGSTSGASEDSMDAIRVPVLFYHDSTAYNDQIM